MKFLNGLTAWLGMLVGHDYVSFEWFFGKLFTPLAYVIGIPSKDCEKIGAVIGSKTIVNEFVAFEQLGKLKAAQLITVILKHFSIVPHEILSNLDIRNFIEAKCDDSNVCYLWVC